MYNFSSYFRICLIAVVARQIKCCWAVCYEIVYIWFWSYTHYIRFFLIFLCYFFSLSVYCRHWLFDVSMVREYIYTNLNYVSHSIFFFFLSLCPYDYHSYCSLIITRIQNFLKKRKNLLLIACYSKRNEYFKINSRKKHHT